MLKLATNKQKAFYENFLYLFQDEIFPHIQSSMFYLTGGTCLSRFYYNHRYSDDLDFFFDGSRFPKEDFTLNFKDILRRISERYKVELEINAEYFKRVFVYKDDSPLKLEFIYESFPLIGERNNEKGILIDSRENILSNKLTAIYGRKTYKDFIDIYFLLKDFDLYEGIQNSEKKMAPLNYEGALLTLVGGNMEGNVCMIRNVEEAEFTNFLKDLTEKLLNHAKTVS